MHTHYDLNTYQAQAEQEGLQAARCLSHKPGFYRPSTSQPIFVPGMHWIALLLLRQSGVPTVATMRWWAMRGEAATNARRVQAALLARCKSVWGRSVLHVFDQGYAGVRWLKRLHHEHVGFLVRWPNRYQLRLHSAQADPQPPASKPVNTWKVVRGSGRRTEECCATPAEARHAR